MAYIPPHTHDFTLPAATLAEAEARARADVLLTPAALPPAATTEQGSKADTALQPEQLAQAIALPPPGQASVLEAALETALPTLKAKADSALQPSASADVLLEGAVNKFLQTTERAKLSGIETGATQNDTDANLRNRSYHTGTQSADTVIDGTTNKAFTSSEKAKLAGVAAGATANSTDAALLARSNHTGAQAISTVTGLQTALDGKATAAQGALASTALQPAAIGASVQAYDGDLAAIAGLVSAANKGIQFTGAGTAATYDLTTAGKALLDDADAAAQRITLGLGTAAMAAATSFATATQGGKADSAIQPATLPVQSFTSADGAIATLQGFFDGLAIDVSFFGASQGASPAANTTAFQKGIDALFAKGGGVLRHSGNYRTNGFVIKKGVHVVGPHPNPGYVGDGAVANYGAQLGVIWVTSTGTISVGFSASLTGSVVIRDGMTTPFASGAAATAAIAAFAGTAVTGAGSDVMVANNLFLGFNRAVQCIGFERPHIFNNRGDCTNGIQVSDCADVLTVKDNHFWPFLTVQQTWTTDLLVTRTGKAYLFSRINGPVGGDWDRLLNNFSYGYAVGTEVHSCDKVLIDAAAHDHQNSLSPASVGVHLTGSSNNCVITNSRGDAQQTGFLFETDAGTVNFLINSGASNADAYGARVVSGGVVIRGGSFLEGPFGVVAESTADFLDVDDTIFKNIANLSISVGGSLDRCTIGMGNRHINCSEGVAPTRYASSDSVTRASADGVGYAEYIRKCRGTRAAPSAVQAGDVLHETNIQGHDGSAFRPAATLKTVVSAAPSGSVIPTLLEVYLSGLKRLAIASDGSIFHKDDRRIFDVDSLLNVRNYTIAAGANQLPTPNAVLTGRLAFATDAKKFSDGLGAGTGAFVFDTGYSWTQISPTRAELDAQYLPKTNPIVSGNLLIVPSPETGGEGGQIDLALGTGQTSLTNTVTVDTLASRVRVVGIRASDGVARTFDFDFLTGLVSTPEGVIANGGCLITRVYLVSTLPTPGTSARLAKASNGRAFNGTGTLEASGAGSGVIVEDSGTAWRVIGTNVTVSA